MDWLCVVTEADLAAGFMQGDWNGWQGFHLQKSMQGIDCEDHFHECKPGSRIGYRYGNLLVDLLV